jgi:hypothetical protein
MRFRLFPTAWVLSLVGSFLPVVVSAAPEPLAPALQRAVVWIQCDDRQGSGTIINGTAGYILTNAHVVMDTKTRALAAACTIGIVDIPGNEPTIFYKASILKSQFDKQRNQDFAILEIGKQAGPIGLTKPFPSLKTDEFATLHEAISLLGYSSTVDNRIVTRSGQILAFENGLIKADTPINPGDSGGAAVDASGNLLGMPTRIVKVTDTSGKEETHYELVDIRAVMNWLDTFGPNEHDKYFTHADYEKYHRNAVFISDVDLGCVVLARSQLSPAVYCINADQTRAAFPNDTTYFSWFPDFKTVILGTTESIAQFRLSKNVTYRPGTLVKSATMNNVYVVVDSFGTMRHIPTEEKASQLWGPNWASLVHDIPDEFWVNYTIGQPLDP